MILESQIQKVLNQLCEKMLVLCLLITLDSVSGETGFPFLLVFFPPTTKYMTKF